MYYDSIRFVRKFLPTQLNLEELEKTDILNHEHTLAKIMDMLLSSASKDRYIELCLKRLMQGQSELKVMIEFIMDEKN